jgi:hypothetical protein
MQKYILDAEIGIANTKTDIDAIQEEGRNVLSDYDGDTLNSHISERNVLSDYDGDTVNSYISNTIERFKVYETSV